MATAAQRDESKNLEEEKLRALNSVVGEQVLHILGEPGDLLRTQVKLLWGRRYRVNVLIGPDVASARIANSYFVKTDGEGNIVESTPKITKQY